jgi:ribosomal protein S18 acetylase RimI-like enzyme
LNFERGSRRWTTRTAVGQTLRVLRRDGVAAAWFGVLAETVYRRLLVVERDLTVAAGADAASGQQPPAIDVRVIDADQVAALYAAIGAERIPDVRDRARETWFAAFEGGRPVAAQALLSGGGFVPYLGINLALVDEAVLLAEVVVDPACRKRGVAARTTAAVLDHAAARGDRRAVALVLPENAGGRALLRSLGFTLTGRVTTYRLGRARRAALHGTAGRESSAVLAVTNARVKPSIPR